MAVLGIYYLYQFKKLNSIILLKILFPCVYMFGAIMHYEIMWNFMWVLYYPTIVMDLVGFTLCEALIVYVLWFMKNKKGYNIPLVNLKRWCAVTGIMVFMILWLNSTGFYIDHLQGIDPHNSVWALGKIFCLLSWVWIPTNRNNHKKG